VQMHRRGKAGTECLEGAGLRENDVVGGNALCDLLIHMHGLCG
jgi:hypothetical protein